MKQIIRTANAPAPIGPYNQAVAFGNLLFVSGQIAIKPGTNQLIQDTIEAETEQVMQNLYAILQQAGTAFQHVIKATIYLSDMNLFETVNRVYGRYFDDETAPARETVAVKGLPKGVNVEISVICALPKK